MTKIVKLVGIFFFMSLAFCQNKTETTQDELSLGIIDIDGSKLDYVVEGEGIPTLVIGSSVYYPKTFSKEIKKHLKMYFVDLKWFAKGYKKEDLSQVDITSIVEDVEQIRQALGLENPLLMGHSIHGTIATEYVKKHQEKVSGLVVIGSPAQWGSDTYNAKAASHWATASDERKALQEKNWGKLSELDRLTGQEEASAEYNNMSPQYWYDASYDATWLWDDMTVHSEFTTHLFTEVFANYDMFQPEVNISVPTLVVMGEYDFVIPHTLWQQKYESIKDFTWVLFDKSGHTPQLEEPDRFNKTLFNWLNTKINE